MLLCNIGENLASPNTTCFCFDRWDSQVWVLVRCHVFYFQREVVTENQLAVVIRL